MEQKRNSLFKNISIIYFICLGLYLLGRLFVAAAGLEYRMWVSVLGSCLFLLGIPVWLFLLWFRWHVRKGGSRALRYGVTAVSAVLFLLWSYFCFLSLVFGVQEERKLFGRYVVVNRAPMLSESDYDLCKTRGLFFREDAEWDSAFEIEYLERKYRRDFLEVPFDKENMLFYDRRGEGISYGETVPVPADHRNLPVNVVLAGGNLDDDYVDLLAGWYVVEGCRELSIDRPYETAEDGTLCLYFKGREDINGTASDLRRLMAYAMQDDIFEEYTGIIRLLPENMDPDDGGAIYISIGKGQRSDLEYEKNIMLLEEYIETVYERILESSEINREAEEKWEEEREAARKKAAEEEAAKEVETAESSIYEEEARLICEQLRASTGIGEEFNVEYNAKGWEYYSLGEDGVYSYTLIYDRDSENGACRLYVLYRSPYDEESGTYCHYTDEMTQIMDIYAVVKGTDKVISSGRKAWSDPGNSEYRRAVGE